MGREGGIERFESGTREPAAAKYDLLTGLGASACRGDKHRQRTVLRFITLLTARYNWRSDTLTTGQREIARLWSVDERTVKREMARLRDLGWLVLKRPAARGRVACYGLGFDAMRAATRPCWDAVGPDYAARMQGPAPCAGAAAMAAPPVADEGPWGRIAARLQGDDAGLYAAWFAPLASLGVREGRLRLRAPSRFHASFLRTHHLDRLDRLTRDEGLALDLVE